ncbi:MAG: FtsX-like permease family protein [Candidatus Coatesbacteria bacterium]
MPGAFGVDLRIAALNLAQHRRRSLLLGGALAAVTGLFVLLSALTAGVRDTMVRNSTALDCGHVNVGGFFKITSGQAAPLVTKYPAVLEVIRREVPELAYAVPRGRGFAKMIGPGGSVWSPVTSLDVTKEPGFRAAVRIESGSLDGMAKPDALLLFHTQAEKLGVKVGDTVTLSAPTAGGINNVIDLTVVAIAHDLGLMSAFSSFVSMPALTRMYRMTDDSTGVILVYLKDIGKAPAVIERLRAAFLKGGWKLMDPDPNPFFMKFDKVNREAWTGQKLDLTTWKDELTFMSWVFTALDAITLILVVVLLGIAVAGIMNVMWIAIRERTREIGTLRALGVQRRQILRMFMIESILLGFAGALAGGVAATLLAVVVTAVRIPVPLVVQLFLLSDHLILIVKPGTFLLAVLGITAVTGVAALYPALRAAKLKPVTAMGHAG